jgi:ribosomal protein L5
MFLKLCTNRTSSEFKVPTEIRDAQRPKHGEATKAYNSPFEGIGGFSHNLSCKNYGNLMGMRSIPCKYLQYSTLSNPRLQSHYENILQYDLTEKLCLTNSYETPKIEKIILSASVSFKPQQVRGLAATSGNMASKVSDRSNTKIAGKKKITGKSRASGMLPNFGHGLEDCTVEVRKALILLSGQSLESKTFRVGRPHLGIRKGRLAAYQVTLRDQSMYLFLERLLLEVIPKVMKTDPATLITGAADRRLQRTSLKVANLQVGNCERVPLDTMWLNDGSHTKEVIQSFFDGNGNFQLGIPDFYLFREIEQNIEFTKLNGLNVTIVTSAKTDREARLLLSGFQAPFAD